MALVKCDECGEEISTEAKACPKCGAKVKKSNYWLMIPVVLLFFFGMFIKSEMDSPQSKERAEKRAGIERCWASYEPKSLTPEEKRFIASACEMMEKDFISKYGYKP